MIHQAPSAPAHQAPQAMIQQAPPASVYQVQPPSPALIGSVQVIPGLPDPNNGRNYRLQVGSFSSTEGAAFTMQLARSAGFNVIEERYGTLHRVVATDVPSAMIPSAVQRLGAIGIRQVWVRE
jgi:cell division septation protein DedD